MATTKIQAHPRPDDEITIEARQFNGTEWVALQIGDFRLTIFPTGNDAVALLDRLAGETAAARGALMLSKRPAIAEPTPVQAGA